MNNKQDQGFYDILKIKETLHQIRTIDLWIEIARRINVQDGTVHMSFSDGKPSTYVSMDVPINTSGG